MEFRFRKASAVAVGTFNIYIVQPEWLREVGLIKTDTKVKVEADLNRPGFRLTWDGSSVKWHVRPDRLLLESESPNDDCGTPLAQVLEVLKWTPLMAVGTNLEFEASSDILSKIKCKLPECDECEGFHISQKTSHVMFSKGDHIFNIQLALETKENKAILSLNVHTDLLPGNQSQFTANVNGQAACRKFVEHCTTATTLVKSLLGVEIAK